MKNLIIKMLLIFFPVAFCQNLTIDGSAAFTKDKLKYNTGIKFSAANLNCAFSIGINSTNIEEIQSPDSFRYGTSYRTNFNSKYLDFTVYAGTINYSQGLSRIKSPAISSSGALKYPASLTPGTSPSLLGYTSAVKPFSVCLSLLPGKQGHFIPAIQLITNEQSEYSACIFKKIPLKNLTVTAQALASTYFLEQKNSNSWYSDKIYFPKDRYAAFLLEGGITSLHLRSFNSLGAAVNPFGGITPWYKNKSSLVLNNFLLNTEFFNAHPGLITASGAYNHTKYQLVVNPQFTFYPVRSKLKTGILLQWNLKNTGKPAEKDYSEYFIKSALSYSRQRYSFGADFSWTPPDAKTDLQYSAKLSAARIFSPVNCQINYGISLGLKYSQSTKYDTTFSQIITPRIKLFPSVKNEFSLILQESEIQYKINSKLNWHYTIKNTRINLYASFTFQNKEVL